MHVRLACVALLALAGSSRADFIRFTDQVSGPSGTVLRLDLPRFDPALGDLTAVRWEMSSQVRGRFVFDNELPVQFVRQADVGSLVGASVQGGFNLFLDAGQLVQFNLAADDEPGLPPDFAGPDSRNLLVTGGNVDSVNLPQVLFPIYTGTSTVFASAGTRTIGIPPGSGVEFVTQEALAVTLRGTLTYQFTPVPEPTTAILVSLAATGAAGLQRYRRQRPAVVRDHQV